ncbi:S46 family peptidase [Rurimicrobium arvi]|uniref:Dipeptidyl-peptidase n=1 Tax=Rurimicrobium arvi TaxID=2049916 RepID=A0ABP8MSX8_9BACT
MKKLFLLFCTVLSLHIARADEGMWIPSLIGKNYEEMKRLGLKLSKDDLYNINKASLKDAVVQFGGGCTGEIISSKGLLLTNHHCGYGAIAALSSVEKNYLDNGYWAKNMAEELPAEGITALFLQRIDDVTGELNDAVGNAKGDKANRLREEAIKAIEKEASKGGKLVANVKEYFNGNQYLLLTYKKYTDVRFVAAPPKSLGKFGGDTDNWMWPRHTADFSIFRVYADADNEPAAYNKNNVPFRPKWHLPVSINGVEEKDYAMIFGYPGRTNRYEVSYGIDLAIKETNPAVVDIRTKRLEIMKRHMDADKSVYLKLTSRYASIANYWKYYIGQTEQLKRLNVVDQKKAEEKAFAKWNAKNDAGFDGLMNDYQNMYADYKPYAKHTVYYSEAFKATNLARIASAAVPLLKVMTKTPEKDSIEKYTKQLQAAFKANIKDYDEATDKELFAEMTRLYYTEVPKSQHPDIFQRVIFKKYGNENADQTFRAYANYVYGKTFLMDEKKVNAFCEHPSLEALENDPAVQYAASIVNNFETYYMPKYEEMAKEKKSLSKAYVKGLMQMNRNELFYPDANSTMRITYGQVLAYQPQDAVSYNFYTTMDGMMAKYKAGDDEFDLPQDLIRLYKKKDYGVYADQDGSLHTCFITNNDITGGNSGSPVINAKGELVGCAFDGNWEAMSGDLAFDKKYKRTIVCDARFILFLIDKLGGAHNLIEEMDIMK